MKDLLRLLALSNLIKFLLVQLLCYALFNQNTHAAWWETQTKEPEVPITYRRDVIIAVIDTGIDLNHPSLKEALWNNPGETGIDQDGNDRSSNGIDDDNNGYVDDVHGWDFTTQTNQPNDEHGHGTHIAGIIAARPKLAGYKGVAPNAKLMILKYFGSSDSHLDFTIKAFEYAVKMKADIINYSGGGYRPSALERKWVIEAQKKGILVVAAAGNDGSNMDRRGFYPASYGLNNIVSVASINQHNRLSKSSNFGARKVDLAAPGEGILSTTPGGGFGLMSGTSQATAFVSGLAAKLISSSEVKPKAMEVAQHIRQTLQKTSSLDNKLRHPGQINVSRSLKMRNHKLNRKPAEFYPDRLIKSLSESKEVLN